MLFFFRSFHFFSQALFMGLIPFRFNRASMVGACPRNRLYNAIGGSVPPFDKILSRKLCATSRLNIPFSLNRENASASRTSAICNCNIRLHSLRTWYVRTVRSYRPLQVAATTVPLPTRVFQTKARLPRKVCPACNKPCPTERNWPVGCKRKPCWNCGFW